MTNHVALDVYAFGKILYELLIGRVLPGVQRPVGEYDISRYQTLEWRILNACVSGLVDHDLTQRMRAWHEFQRASSLVELALEGKLSDDDENLVDFVRTYTHNGGTAPTRNTTAPALRYDSPPDVVIDHFVEYLAGKEEVRLKDFLSKGVSLVKAAVQGNNVGSVRPVVQVLSALACRMVVLDEVRWFEKIIDTLVQVHQQGGWNRHQNGPPLWYEIVVRAYAIGSLCVRQQRWKEVRWLVTKRIDDKSYQKQRCWLLSSVEHCSSHNLFGKSGNPLDAVKAVCEAEEALLADHPVGSDVWFSSICQFDFIAAMIYRESGEYVAADFSQYWAQYTIPMIEKIASDTDVRRQLFEGTLGEFANILTEIMRVAESRGIMQGWRADGSTPALAEVIRVHTKGR